MEIRTRIAPSPTGFAHLGLLARALTNFALAKQNNGKFIWRNEDTDVKRFVDGALEYNMKWIREFGLEWDEGPDIGGRYAPYNQTERLDLYKMAYEKLISNGFAYRCFCTEERLTELRDFQKQAKQQTHYDKRCRNLSSDEIKLKLEDNIPFTVRVKMTENKRIEFDDVITKTHISWNSNDVEDYIIVKSNGIPTYHLASVVDDIEMKISHVFRGAEWIATTPVHLTIYEGLGINIEERPKIGHFTVILDPKTPGKKFSKRDSSFRIDRLVINGYLKEAVLNYLMLLGWAPKDNRELFTLNEFIQIFDLSGMQKANPTWDQKKMDWFNGTYLRSLTDEEFTSKFLNWIKSYLLKASIKDIREIFFSIGRSEESVEMYIRFAAELINLNEEILLKQLKLVKERAVNFWEVLEQIYFFYYFDKEIDWNIKQLKNVQEYLIQIRKDLLESMANILTEDSLKWDHLSWEKAIRDIADKYKIKHGDLFMVLRVAIVGSPFSPPLFESMQLLGRKEVLERLTI